MILISEYNQKWPEYFKELRARIWPKISTHALSVEHVGSTSVPGLHAKPVIDMDIIIQDMSKMSSVKEALVDLGYEHRGNMGIEGREAFRLGPQLYKHNLYVCTKDCISLRNHLLLRDFLRANETVKNQYGKLKLNLAQQYADSIDHYIEGKTEFTLDILKNQGMALESLETIRLNNKAPSK